MPDDSILKGKKDTIISFRCSTEFFNRLSHLAKCISENSPNADQISISELAHKFVKQGMDSEIKDLLFLKNNIDAFLKQR